ADNGNLASILENKNVLLDWDIRWKFAKEILSAISYLHQKNIVHRKLKSSNVLVTKYMEIKLGDFELCRNENYESDDNDDENIHLDKMTKLFPWMAPELFLNNL